MNINPANTKPADLNSIKPGQQVFIGQQRRQAIAVATPSGVLRYAISLFDRKHRYARAREVFIGA